MSKRCPYEHGTVCTFDIADLKDCKKDIKCKPKEAGHD